jgi:histidine triad (HIT) family protein
MSSIFSKIVRGEIPCYKVAEDENFLAFLDITPIKRGHVLVIPKVETDYIFDIEDQSIADFMIFTKKVAIKIKNAFPCKKIGVTVIGLEVPHAHIHLVPMNSLSDMNFQQEKLSLSQKELKEISELISKS